jgi:hypothetical protein
MTNHPFPYLAKFAEKYGRDEIQIRQYQDDSIQKLSRKQLAELGNVHRQIINRGDSNELWRWINDKSDDEGKLERRRAMLLVFLLNGLARHDIAPFNEALIASSTPEPPLDWSKLPGELTYLIEAASRYGIIEGDQDVDDFCESVSETQLRELQEISKRMDKDAARIDAFLHTCPMTEHPEACRVYFLTGLIDALRCSNKLS